MARPRLITLVELQRMPAGERGPRLRSLMAFQEAKASKLPPEQRGFYLSTMRHLRERARQVGLEGFGEA